MLDTEIFTAYCYALDEVYRIPITGANVHEMKNVMTSLRLVIDGYMHFGVLPPHPETNLWRIQKRIDRLGVARLRKVS